MSSRINNTDFTDVGELMVTPEYGLIIKFTFGKLLQRVCKRLYGKKLEVSFKELEYQRSGAQNRWLWGVAYVRIASFLYETQGERISKEAIHSHTLQVILKYEMVLVDVAGKTVAHFKGKSTSQLSTKKFMQLKDDLQLYWSERGCVIPDPRENNFLSDLIVLEDE